MSSGSTSGIKLRVKKGDLELEIEVGADVSEEQLKIIQKLLLPLTSNITVENQSEKKRKTRTASGETTYNRLKKAISFVFRNGEWFTSMDARDVFEDLYEEPIETSTCSTYLRRMEREGFLESRKTGYGKIIEYRIADFKKAEVLAAKVVVKPRD